MTTIARPKMFVQILGANGADPVAESVQVVRFGTVAATLDDVVSAASGIVPTIGSIDVTLGDATSAASGTVTAETLLVKTIDPMGTTSGPFNSEFTGFDSGVYGTLPDDSFGADAITQLFVSWNSGVTPPGPSQFQIRVDSDAHVAGDITQVLAEGIGTFGTLETFDDSGGTSLWIFSSATELGPGDWEDGLTRDVTLTLG